MELTTMDVLDGMMWDMMQYILETAEEKEVRKAARVLLEYVSIVEYEDDSE